MLCKAAYKFQIAEGHRFFGSGFIPVIFVAESNRVVIHIDNAMVADGHFVGVSSKNFIKDPKSVLFLGSLILLMLRCILANYFQKYLRSTLFQSNNSSTKYSSTQKDDAIRNRSLFIFALVYFLS